MDFSLTSAQQTFYTEKVTRDIPVWSHALCVMFSGRRSDEELIALLNEIIKENEVFRLRFTKDENENLFQTIVDHEDKEFNFFNFENIKELDSFMQKSADTPCLLCENPYEFSVFRLPGKFGIMLRIHHMISDGFCVSLLIDKIKSKLGLIEKETKTYSYQRHIENELLYKESKRFEKNIAFWNRLLSQNFSNTLFDIGVSSFDYSCDEKIYSFSGDSAKRVKKICEKENIPFFSFVYAMFAVYVKRVLEIDDFSVGMSVLNRLTEEDMHTLGLYMHILPLIMHVSDEDTCISVLEKAYDSIVNLLKNQKFTQYDIRNNCTFEKRNEPLFDVTVDFQPEYYLSDCESKVLYANKLSTPLEIHFYEGKDDDLSVRVRYRTNIFRESNITDMLVSLEGIMDAFAENPFALITEASIESKYKLTEEEKQKLLCDFNNTTHKYDIPEKSTLYSIFETTAKKNRDKVCIKTAEKSLTFGELLTVSENLDTEIRGITKGKKSIIAVIAERSVEMYAAIYGIIRGGNAYLPIDPDYPKERIAYILKNSEAAAVVAQGKFAHLAGDVPCLDMTSFVNDKAVQRKAPLSCAAEENDTAYVIYTSGSTGNPKGAKISNKSAVNRILWMHDKYPMEENSVILQKTPYTFDVSVWELFWWGMCGGSLAASKPGEHFLPGKILDEIHNGKVTHLHFVPSVFDLFLNYLEGHKDECGKLHSVKHIFLSGEALTASLIQRFYDLFDFCNVKLHNLYGPTECAVDVTYYDCKTDDIDPVPIGKPIYNTQIYVVDKNMNLLPIGVTGELCIGGVNVGQGYLNNETLTAEKFVDDPFGEGKLYKTGDLAYWREDGEIIFCGRRDGQVKLNGQRMEIGEIEAVISSIPEVESVAVLMRNVNGQDMLVAYCCGNPEAEEKIISVCETKLPKYMVPKAVRFIEEMPLTTSGKLNRKALSNIKIISEESNIIEEPINEEERVICEAFSRILAKKNIGRNSDFFILGGSSLSMISMLSEDGFQNITVAEFIANSTPSKLAELIKDKRKTNRQKHLEVLWKAEDEKKAIVLFPFAGGGAEAYANFVSSIKSIDRNMSVYFVHYLHSKEDCKEAAKEISDVLGRLNVYFYSHCVGSAVAIQILKFLEADRIGFIKHYIAGASIPTKKPTKKNVWDFVSDKVLQAILVKAGAPLKAISAENVFKMLKQFREDTDFSSKSFYENRSKIKTPVSVILSKNDIFTYNYDHAEKIWNKYAETVKGIHFIDSVGHYFQSEKSDDLVRMILSVTD